MTDKSLGTFINPFTDFGFKKLFGSEESKPLLISFKQESELANHFYFLRELVTFDDVPAEFQNDIIAGAFELAKLANMRYADRHAYELSLKYYRDFINVMDTAKKEAKEEGRLEEKLDIVKTMLEEGFDIHTIIKITGLSKQTLENLKSQCNL